MLTGRAIARRIAFQQRRADMSAALVPLLVAVPAFAAGALLAVLVCRRIAAADRARAVAVAEARIAELERMQCQLRETFQALSADALRANNDSFLQLATTELERVRQAAALEAQAKHEAFDRLVAPIAEGLAAYDAKLAEIERARTASFATLAERMEIVARASSDLRKETSVLARALTSSNARGTWGELQLRRVCELAGMLDHCDFHTQSTIAGAADRDARLRPDLIVNLPGGTTIVVDAKAPATAFLDATAATDEARRAALLQQHAGHVKRHMDALSRKSYWEQFARAPEFVVLFLPSEALFSAALEHEPSLIEHGVAQGVVIATPTTLISLLKAVAIGWRQERIAANAQAVSALGRQLHDRLRILAEHLTDVGTHLGRTVAAYNRSVGSLEQRVLVSARRFHELGAAGPRPIGELAALEIAPNLLADELRLEA